MHTSKIQWLPEVGWTQPEPLMEGDPSWILLFGAPSALEDASGPVARLRSQYPQALCMGCSTAGEIFGGRVSDGTIAGVLVRFDGTRVAAAVRTITSAEESHALGRALAEELIAPDLRHVLVLSDGLKVNGTALTDGFNALLPPGVGVTGGLAGDGADFQRTLLVYGDEIAPDLVVAAGFYGDSLQVRYGSAGGWDPFGPRRLITKSTGNILYELDGQPALALYKRYLGERAADLPATGLLFPLEILTDTSSATGLVRTILAVDEEAQSLTFAGDIPQGQYARLMKASCDRLVSGAENAADRTGSKAPSLAVLVSCVGRKLVMGQRTEEEIEAVLGVLGEGVQATGFYSYGEICPGMRGLNCELHNQTMTLTTFSEER